MSVCTYLKDNFQSNSSEGSKKWRKNKNKNQEPCSAVCILFTSSRFQVYLRLATEIYIFIAGFEFIDKYSCIPKSYTLYEKRFWAEANFKSNNVFIALYSWYKSFIIFVVSYIMLTIYSISIVWVHYIFHTI